MRVDESVVPGCSALLLAAAGAGAGSECGPYQMMLAPGPTVTGF